MFSLGYFAKVPQLLEFHQALRSSHSLRATHHFDEFMALDAAHRESYHKSS
jgi:hypothetical protein